MKSDRESLQKARNFIAIQYAEIERLKGMLSCSNGEPSNSTNRDYISGYSEQYALEQQKTALAMEAF